ncbi:pyruvate kinase alpha/beta domain-containing protein [Cellulosilyticum ruminicola]|uniref:pyruvate kinase alpha/beta domain-containing protein n=1 Tax=Cellulosilyticum ruminicola TaxID=425254 RepID=UPI002E8DEC7B|nr:pyruvate kinase alpha/beta domain-containing protein [Cellulosilyticum ruminicola]
MVKIVQSTEEDIDYIKRFNHQVITALRTIGNAICTTAHDIKVKLIITVTKSGQTARMISKYRPACMIMGCSPEAQVVR